MLRCEIDTNSLMRPNGRTTPVFTICCQNVQFSQPIILYLHLIHHPLWYGESSWPWIMMLIVKLCSLRIRSPSFAFTKCISVSCFLLVVSWFVMILAQHMTTALKLVLACISPIISIAGFLQTPILEVTLFPSHPLSSYHSY